MIDFLVEQFLALILAIPTGFLSFYVAMWYFNKYTLPKMVPKMAVDTAKVIREQKEIKELVAKGKAVLGKIEPIIDKVDPEAINELIKTVNDLAGIFKDRLETPKIPNPD